MVRCGIIDDIPKEGMDVEINIDMNGSKCVIEGPGDEIDVCEKLIKLAFNTVKHPTCQLLICLSAICMHIAQS